MQRNVVSSRPLSNRQQLNNMGRQIIGHSKQLNPSVRPLPQPRVVLVQPPTRMLVNVSTVNRHVQPAAQAPMRLVQQHPVYQRQVVQLLPQKVEMKPEKKLFQKTFSSSLALTDESDLFDENPKIEVLF